jgi:hypothetical protein
MTVVTYTEAARLPAGTAPVAPWGLLSRVHRPCPDHAGECPCVGRDEDVGCLVFWCEREEHHFRAR